MKVLVDSTVWIDFLRNRNTPHTDKLVELIQARADLCLCGFIMTEVLQGIREEKQYVMTKQQFGNLIYFNSISPVSLKNKIGLFVFIKNSRGYTL